MKIVIDETGEFEPSLLALKKYCELKNIKIFFYKHNYIYENDECKDDGYYKVKDYENSYDEQYAYFTKDLGERITDKEIPEGEYWFDYWNIKRDDTDLIKVIKELGEKANGYYSKFKIIEIPDDVDWYIAHGEMGGEWIAEKHRTWY